jgi:cytoskeletal protein CcmA (bactofilin family)
MSLFRRKPPEEEKPTLVAPATAEHLEAPPLAVELKERLTIDTPASDNTQIDAALNDPEECLSSPGKPNQGALMAPNRSPSVGFVPEIPRRPVNLPSAPGRRASTPQHHNSEGKRLVVGRDISLSGEIKACDSLIVEGAVEATLENSRFLEVAEGGVFIGAVVIDEAVIAGYFEGAITARERLTIKSSGRIKGNVKFKQIEIELGGEIDGDLHVLESDTPADPSLPS